MFIIQGDNIWLQKEENRQQIESLKAENQKQQHGIWLVQHLICKKRWPQRPTLQNGWQKSKKQVEPER